MGSPESDDYSSVVDPDSEALGDVEEFLRGLSTDDLDALERYVVDEQRVNDEPLDQYEDAVGTLPDDDGDAGELVSVVQPTAALKPRSHH